MALKRKPSPCIADELASGDDNTHPSPAPFATASSTVTPAATESWVVGAVAAARRARKRFVGVRQRPSGRWVAEIKDTIQKIRVALQAGRAVGCPLAAALAAKHMVLDWWEPAGHKCTRRIGPLDVADVASGFGGYRKAAGVCA
ncbi:hypothetical protein ACP70R_024997 [Stipagrostis hirtigluma subsp. patula]